MIDSVRYKAHRLAWLYVYGYFPENDIDHINRMKDDNSIANLREVSRQCNIRNVGLRSTNKTGVTGVSWCKRFGKWQAQIRADKMNKNLGYYVDFIDAVRSRWKAEIKYNFPNCNTISSSYTYLEKYNLLEEKQGV